MSGLIESSKEYLQGWAAFTGGIARDSNPYKWTPASRFGDRKRATWERGWDAAADVDTMMGRVDTGQFADVELTPSEGNSLAGGNSNSFIVSIRTDQELELVSLSENQIAFRVHGSQEITDMLRCFAEIAAQYRVEWP